MQDCASKEREISPEPLLVVLQHVYVSGNVDQISGWRIAAQTKLMHTESMLSPSSNPLAAHHHYYMN